MHDSVSFSDPNILDSASNLPHCFPICFAIRVGDLKLLIFSGLCYKINYTSLSSVLIALVVQSLLISAQSLSVCHPKRSCAKVPLSKYSFSVLWLPLQVPLLLVSIIAQLFIPIMSPQLFNGSKDVTCTQQNGRVLIYCPDLLRRIKNYPLWCPATSCSHRLFKPCLAPHDNNNVRVDF
jgi:hypothetical protein